MRVQIFEERFAGAGPRRESRREARLWEIMTGIWPDYDTYQTHTERSIPLVIIERI